MRSASSRPRRWTDLTPAERDFLEAFAACPPATQALLRRVLAALAALPPEAQVRALPMLATLALRALATPLTEAQVQRVIDGLANLTRRA